MIYDCIIIGAGPAGTFCGYLLAKEGFSCLILDKLKEYGEKVCGGWVPNIALEELRRAGIEVDSFGIEHGIRTKSCRTVRGDKESVYTYPEGRWGFGTTRYFLDGYLGRQAVNAGVKLCFGEKAGKIILEDGIYYVNGYQGKTLVMAAGAKSSPAQSFGVSMQIRAESDLNCEQVTFWYDSESTANYFWAIPIGERLWNVGYWMQKAEQNIAALFWEKWNKHLAAHLKSYEVVIPLKGAFLGNVGRTADMDVPVIGIGDFNGENNIETGEGISFALRSAVRGAALVRKQMYKSCYERVEIIEGEGVCAAFLCDRLEYFAVSREEKAVIEGITKGMGMDEIKEKSGLSSMQLAHLLEKLKKENKVLEADVKTNSVRLTFNVSNCCNMSCKYCYANGGSYLSSEKLMDIETAQKALELFHGQYRTVSSIKFIGGEPALNLDVVQYICMYEQQLVDEGVQEKLPEFIFVTNGTIVNDKLIRLAGEYHVKIGISYDAPDKINDRLRVMNDGTSGSRLIRKNIRRLKEATDGREPYSVNAVYTRVEEEAGMSVSDIVHFIYEDLGIPSAHIIPVDPKDGPAYKLSSNQSFVDAADTLLREWRETGEKKFFNNLKGIIRKLEKRLISPNYICDAGFGLFSVACDGKIYPCHLFTDIEDFCLGTVDDQIFETEKFRRLSEGWKNYHRVQHSPCRECFGNRLCIGCMGANYFRTGDQYKPEPFICDMFRKVVKRVILEYVIQGKVNQ